MSSAVEDVDMDDTAAEFPGRRYDLKCPDCGGTLMMRRSGKLGRPFYGCTKFPECRGCHGAHFDGSPLGVPGDRATREARKRAHELFDKVWQNRLVQDRQAAYKWLMKALGLSVEMAHIARLTIEQCSELHRKVLKQWPQLRTVWDRLLKDDVLDELILDLDDPNDYH